MINERLPWGWSIEIREDEAATYLTIAGPESQGAAFKVERNSICAQVLRNFLASIQDSQAQRSGGENG